MKSTIIGMSCIIIVLTIVIFGMYFTLAEFEEEFTSIEKSQIVETVVVDENKTDELLEELNGKMDTVIEKLDEIEIEVETKTVEIDVEAETEPTEPVLEILEDGVVWYSDYRVYLSNEPTITAGGEEFDKEFLAKLLYCEAGATSWECQVYTCSAILNLCDLQVRSLWNIGHDKNVFSVAPYVDDAEPTQISYDVVDYVLEGGRVEEICYFRNKYYHTFGTPVCEVGGHYFSM